MNALRDVLQNHVLQLLYLVAMEPPAMLQARHIYDEKMKLRQALRPGVDGSVNRWVARRQYLPASSIENRLGLIEKKSGFSAV